MNILNPKQSTFDSSSCLFSGCKCFSYQLRRGALLKRYSSKFSNPKNLNNQIIIKFTANNDKNYICNIASPSTYLDVLTRNLHQYFLRSLSVFQFYQLELFLNQYLGCNQNLFAGQVPKHYSNTLVRKIHSPNSHIPRALE